MAMLSYLVASLKQFQEQYIQVKINIFNYNTPQTLNELKAGKIDLAIITTPFDHEQSLKVVKVKDFNSVLVGGSHIQRVCGKGCLSGRGRKTAVNHHVGKHHHISIFSGILSLLRSDHASIH